MTTDMSHFHTRHDQGWHSIALQELVAGRKRSHWVWWTFPQLDGLGSSPNSRCYALPDDDAARDYLADPILLERLTEVTQAVADQLSAGVALEKLMGGRGDARKLVSSLTLFAGVADFESPAEDRLRLLANEVLFAAIDQGIGTCAYTRSVLCIC